MERGCSLHSGGGLGHALIPSFGPTEAKRGWAEDEGSQRNDVSLGSCDRRGLLPSVLWRCCGKRRAAS